MLKNGLQVIAHYAGTGAATGTLHCRGFLNVRMIMPSLVAFIGMDPGGEAIAARLGYEFCRRIGALAGAAEATPGGLPQMPCRGRIPSSVGCHAINEPDCRKLLVLVGDDA